MACGPSVGTSGVADGGASGVDAAVATDGVILEFATGGAAAIAVETSAAAEATFETTVAEATVCTGGGTTAGFTLAISRGGEFGFAWLAILAALSIGRAATTGREGTGGVAEAAALAPPSTHPSGGTIITILLHFGHSRICPMALRLRTAMRARQVVQETEKSDLSTLLRLCPSATTVPARRN